MTRRLPPMVKAVHKAWGHGFTKLKPPMGPLEGNPIENAEAILHDLCHAATLLMKPKHGKCKGLEYAIEDVLEAKPLRARVQNEINTIAAEAIVLERIGIEVPWSTLVYLGRQNTRLSEETFNRRAKFAKSRPEVKLAAKKVEAFIIRKKTFA